MSRDAIDMLTGISFGLAYHAGTGPAPTVTIELGRREAEAFLWKLSKELQSIGREFGGAPGIIGLGAAFQYRGVNFRVVEGVSKA